jgi:hypothetical protein
LFLCFLLVYVKLLIVRSFIMTFPYMHVMYFDHIYTSPPLHFTV